MGEFLKLLFKKKKIAVPSGATRGMVIYLLGPPFVERPGSPPHTYTNIERASQFLLVHLRFHSLRVAREGNKEKNRGRRN